MHVKMGISTFKHNNKPQLLFPIMKLEKEFIVWRCMLFVVLALS